MANPDSKTRSQHVAGNFNFAVTINSLSIAGISTLELDLPVDKVGGLSTPKVNVIRHRQSGFSDLTQTPYPGLAVPDGPVTLEGTCLFDMNDLIKLQEWHQQSTGKAPLLEVGGYWREVVVTPTIQSETYSQDGIGPLNVTKRYTLQDCIATKLSVSDFDVNNPAILNWMLEIEYKNMVISS